MEPGDLADDPLDQIRSWSEEAREAGEPMPEAMCLATASADGAPSARMVLLRGVDTGLVFYTDYGSAKGADLLANPRAAAVLH
ncbi:MAG: pyridoxamine 5'-phosphate oxidase family protein, partial [Acidimicrobiales bacterium]